MRGVFWSLRRTAMVAVAIGSVAGAAAMTWMLQVGQLGTAHLLVILALFILPGATFVAWCLDRKHRRDSTVEDNGLFELPDGVEVEEADDDEASQDDALIVETDEPGDRRVHQPHRRRQSGRVSRRG